MLSIRTSGLVRFIVRFPIARRLLALRLSSGKRGVKQSQDYYPEISTCQIPHLSFIYERFFGQRNSGQFVEIGAFDGVFVSNSWGLAERGWRGLMAEPQLEAWRACKKNHVNHPGVSIERTAIGAPGVRFVQLIKAGALSTANRDLAAEYANVSWSSGQLRKEDEVVACITLNDFLMRNCISRCFDVLIIDVEGFEAEVVCGFDLAHWRPKMLIIELADLHPDLSATTQSDAELLVLIQGLDYQIVYKDHINTVFVAKELWQRILGPR